MMGDELATFLSKVAKLRYDMHTLVFVARHAHHRPTVEESGSVQIDLISLVPHCYLSSRQPQKPAGAVPLGLIHSI